MGAEEYGSAIVDVSDLPGLPNRSHVTLTVYNTLGQQVALLQNGEQNAGYHQVQFDGSGLSSGVYFYRIESGSFLQTRKLLLVQLPLIG